MSTVEMILSLLAKQRLSLENEKDLQRQMMEVLSPTVTIAREVRLDAKSTIDFRTADGVGIEVKLDGSPKAIYRQLERYLQFDEIKSLILVTNRSMGLPPTANDKDLFYLNLGRAWL